MLGRKEDAAVLVGQYGDIEAAYLLRDRDRIFLVHADEGPEHGIVGEALRKAEVFGRLAGHLSQALARNDAIGPDASGEDLRRPHHARSASSA